MKSVLDKRWNSAIDHSKGGGIGGAVITSIKTEFYLGRASYPLMWVLTDETL